MLRTLLRDEGEPLEPASKAHALSRWVFCSSRESIANNIPSLTGAIETFIAVVLYWTIAIRYETYLLLITSVAVAPLVLLRSDASVALGVRWFTTWEKKLSKLERGEYSKLAFGIFPIGGIIVMVAAAVAAGVAYVLTAQLGFSGAWWVRVLLGAAIGWVSVWLAGAVATALGISLIVSVSSPGLAFGTSAAAVIASAATGDLLAAIGVAAAAASIAGVRTALFPFPFPGILGFAPGIFLVTLAMRFLASCRHPWLGLRALPGNFRRLTLCTSPIHMPELIPGLKQGHTRFDPYSVLARIIAIRAAKNRQQVFRVFLIDIPRMFIWFSPGWLYRFTLKSTAWYWWCLAVMGRDLRRAKDPELFHWTIMGSLWAKTSIATAIATIIAFVFINFVWPGSFQGDNPLLTVVGYFLLMDFGTLRSWQVLPVVIAMLTIVIVYLTNDATWQWRHASARLDGTLLLRVKRRFGWIELMSRFRLLIVIAYLLLVGMHTLLYFNSRKCWFSLPPNVERWAEWVYAERLPHMSCSATGVDAVPSAPGGPSARPV